MPSMLIRAKVLLNILLHNLPEKAATVGAEAEVATLVAGARASCTNFVQWASSS